MVTAPAGGIGATAATRFTQSADFYDFGVAVRVSAPPPGQVHSISHLGNGTATSVTTGISGHLSSSR